MMTSPSRALAHGLLFTALLLLAALAPSAQQAGDTWTTPGNYEIDITRTGPYRITAQGGTGGHRLRIDGSQDGGARGGQGALLDGVVDLEAGDRLLVVVGSGGTSPFRGTEVGGAGGSAVILIPLAGPRKLLMVAGGGGGAHQDLIAGLPGLSRDGAPGGGLAGDGHPEDLGGGGGGGFNAQGEDNWSGTTRCTSTDGGPRECTRTILDGGGPGTLESGGSGAGGTRLHIGFGGGGQGSRRQNAGGGGGGGYGGGNGGAVGQPGFGGTSFLTSDVRADRPIRRLDGTSTSGEAFVRLRLDVEYTVDTLLDDGSTDPAGCADLSTLTGCSLRQAITGANALDAIATINFAPSVGGTIPLGQALPPITNSVRIEGPGADLLTVRRSTGGAYRILDVAGGIDVAVSGLTLSGGDAVSGDGGAIRNQGTLALSEVILTDNIARTGGGVWNSGTLALTASTVHANTASQGGGIFNNGTLTVTRSTLSNNPTASGAQGILSTGTVRLVSSTIVEAGAGAENQGGTLATRSSLFLNTTTGTPPLVGPVTSEGYNVCAQTCGLTGTADLNGVDTQLNLLADNGGPTPTHSIRSGSAAIDIGGSCGPTDQRGAAAPTDGDDDGMSACDAGAVEAAGVSLIVTTRDDTGDGVCDLQCSLREAIGEALANPSRSRIEFASGVRGILDLSGALPEITGQVEIVGPGADVLTVRRTSGGEYRVLTVTSAGDLTLSGLTLSGGRALTGGGLSNAGTLRLSEAVVTANTATGNGGGVYNTGTLTIDASTIHRNTAVEGGGIANDAGMLDVSRSTVSGNSASARGGGILNDVSGTMSLSLSTIARNTAPETSAIQDRGATTYRANIIDGIANRSTTQPLGDGNVCSSGNDCPRSVRSGDLRLSPLGQNGGPTPTHFLLPGSIAIDAVSCAPPDDQRGQTRSVDNPFAVNLNGSCDAGALEVQAAEAIPSRIYVDAEAGIGGDGRTWDSAFGELRDALAGAVAGDEVWIAQGTYTPSLDDRTASFGIEPGMKLYGGFLGVERELVQRDPATGPTVLSGDLDGDDVVTWNGASRTLTFENNGENSYNVVFAEGSSEPLTAETVLDGLTISGGNANLDGDDVRSKGGGLFCRGRNSGSECSPTVSNVRFVHNAARFGGAVYADGRNQGLSAPSFVNVTFFQNAADVSGGAVYAHTRDGGTASPTFANVVLAQNTATSFGGAIYADAQLGGTASPTFDTSTFVQNAAGQGGGVIWGRGGTSVSTLTNSIVWDNTSPTDPVFKANNASAVVTRSLVQGGCPGSSSCTDLVSGDPGFLSPSTGVFALGVGSPAIDAGDATRLPTDTADLDGDGDRTEALPLDLAGTNRQQGSGLDLGAFEFFPGAGQLTGADGWRMLAAPSTSATVGSFLDALWTQGFPGADAETGTANVYRYDESAPGGLDAGYVAPSASVRLAPGTGLFVYVFADDDPSTPEVDGGFPKTLRVDGSAPTAAAFDVPLSYTDSSAPAEDDGWNLAGNPFDSGAVRPASSPGVAGATYVWSPAQGRYLSRTMGVGDLSETIPAYQGFWVQTTATNPELTLTRAADVSLVGRTVTRPQIRLAVTGASGESDTAWITTAETASADLDAFDALELGRLGEAPVRLFAVADGEAGPVAVDVSVLPEGGAEVPLVVDVAAGGDAVLTWPTVEVPDDWRVVLMDHETGAEIDLRQAAEYPFTATARETTEAARTRPGPPLPRALRLSSDDRARRGGSDARFSLVVSTGLATTTEDVPAVTGLGLPRPNPTASGATLELALAQAGPVRAEVYDALGRRVAVLADGPMPVGRHALQIEASALASGTYIVRVMADAGVHTQTLTVVR